MAEALVNQIYLVTLKGTLNQQTIMNTFHYRIFNMPAGGQTVAQVYVHLEDYFEAAGGIIEKYLACLPTNYSLDVMWVQCVGPTERYVKTTALQGLDGTGVGEARTSNLAGVITRTTEKSGRSQVSALHLPIGGDDTWLAGGSLQPAVRLAMAALCTELVKDTGDPPNLVLDPVIYHGPPPFAAADFIVKAVPQDTARVMRRRTVGLGI